MWNKWKILLIASVLLSLSGNEQFICPFHLQEQHFDSVICPQIKENIFLNSFCSCWGPLAEISSVNQETKTQLETRPDIEQQKNMHVENFSSLLCFIWQIAGCLTWPGTVAQWSRHLPNDVEVVGSSPYLALVIFDTWVIRRWSLISKLSPKKPLGDPHGFLRVGETLPSVFIFFCRIFLFVSSSAFWFFLFFLVFFGGGGLNQDQWI